MSVTPNMNITLPTPSVTVGPEWAQTVNEGFENVDDHDHSSGKGKKITPAGMDINEDLDIDENNLTNVNTVEFVNQDEPLSGVSNICRLQFVDGNFYIVNAGGTPVQITDGDEIVSTVIVPSSPLMPAGTVLDFAGGTVPVGFLACNGAAVSRSTYSDLYNAIGTVWGIGDGSTTFNLPNFQGRTSIGSGSYTDSVAGAITRSLATALGAATHILTEAQLATHTHVQAGHVHAQVGYLTSSGGAFQGSSYSDAASIATTTTTNTASTIATNNNTGLSEAHNNMQPSLVVTKMIKT